MVKRIAWIAGIVAGLMVICAAGAGRGAVGSDAAKKEIEAFNERFIEAHLKMDNAAIMSLWAEADKNWRITREIWNQGVKP